jgi:cytidylate kinase
MSIVAISQTLGSLGEEIGREVARVLAYDFADREIILQAADQFGEGIARLEHLTEGKPSLWERLTETRRRYLAYVEAIVWEMAARDDVVLVGRGATFVLQGVRHVLRVRVSGPPPIRARRLEDRRGLTPDAAEAVRTSDRERAARIRFLYHVGWDEPLHYDLVVNTERLDVAAAADLVQTALRAERLQPTPASRAEVRDRSLVARAQAALLVNPLTRDLSLFMSCQDGQLTVSGRVTRDEERQVAEEILAGIRGVARILCEIAVVPPAPTVAPL